MAGPLPGNGADGGPGGLMAATGAPGRRGDGGAAALLFGNGVAFSPAVSPAGR